MPGAYASHFTLVATPRVGIVPVSQGWGQPLAFGVTQLLVAQLKVTPRSG